MLSNATEDLIDSYISEIQQKIPVQLALIIAASCILYYSSQHGSWQSAILSALNMSIDSLIDEDAGLASLPLYVFVVAILGTHALASISKIAFIMYLRFLTSLKGIREKISTILKSGNRTTKDFEQQPSEFFIEELTNKIQLDQDKFRKRSENGIALVVAGVILTMLSIVGNFIEVVCGLLITYTGAYFLHISASEFLNSILVKRAEIKHILLLLKERDAHRKSPIH